jgi:restriction endonuclease
MLYKLDSVDAYEQKLVKQIEVAGINVADSHNTAYIKLHSVNNKKSPITAKIEIDCRQKGGGIKRKVVTVNDTNKKDLFELSGGRDIYDGYIVNEIYCKEGEEYIDFTSKPESIGLREAIGEVNEDEYKFLKSFIEGGISNDADNVSFYITSNRRHLIKEIRSERENDIHIQDFIQEMTSLSDRFGLTLFYEAPKQKVYFEIITNMLKEYNVSIPQQELETKARQWSLENGGMSGRTAVQFVKSLLM